MRCPESQIKAAILHPEGEVRLTSVRYFAESHMADTSIMPLVTQALDRYQLYPRNDEMLWLAQHLPQSPATVDWIMAKLQKPIDEDDLEQDNLRYSLGEVLLRANADLLARRHREILALPIFPAPLCPLLGEILKLEFMDWRDLWAEFQTTARAGMQRGQLTRPETRRLNLIMRAMARHPQDAAQAVLPLLEGPCRDPDKALFQWLEPWLVEIAGAARLKEAVPLLIKRVDEDDENLHEHLAKALSLIGGDEVIKAVAEKWGDTALEGCFTLAEPLEHVHSELAVKHILQLLEEEDEPDLRLALGFTRGGLSQPRSVLFSTLQATLLSLFFLLSISFPYRSK